MRRFLRKTAVWWRDHVFDPRCLQNGRLLTLPQQMQIRYDCRQLVSRIVAHEGVFEPWLTAVLQRNLRPGSVFIDLGANIGYFTLLAAPLIRPHGRVLAVEPLYFRALDANINLNQLTGIVTVIPAAIHDTATSVRMAAPARGELAGATITGTGTNLAIPAKTLDEVCADLHRVDWIKMDIEGAEGHALLSGLNTLRKFRPHMILAWSPPALERLGTPQMEVHRLLTELGYQLYTSAQAMQRFTEPSSEDWEHTVLAISGDKDVAIPPWQSISAAHSA